jgi:hypothetical protein
MWVGNFRGGPAGYVIRVIRAIYGHPSVAYFMICG